MCPRTSSLTSVLCPQGGCFTSWVAALVREHRDRLLALARRRGLSPEESFDCVQESFATFLRLPGARSLVDRPEESAKLLTTITGNAARTHRRSLDRAARRVGGEPSEEVADGARSAEDRLSWEEECASLRQCVLSLSEVQRAVVTLRMLEDIPGSEVARMLGLSPQYVAVLLHRAKDSLRGCMLAAGHDAGRV